MDAWGVASFDNDAAGDWFLIVQEDPDRRAVIAAAIDAAISAADELELGAAREAIAAAELCASCAGHGPERLPDRVADWVQSNPHGPHADEVALMTDAIGRVREDSELRGYWEEAEDVDRWLDDVDDLLTRLRRSSAGAPPRSLPDQLARRQSAGDRSHQPTLTASERRHLTSALTKSVAALAALDAHPPPRDG